MRWLFLALLVVTCVFTGVESVEDAVLTRLEPDGEVGEAAQAGGFFSALMTSGSMTMMQAGSFEEESLGEAAAAASPGGGCEEWAKKLSEEQRRAMPPVLAGALKRCHAANSPASTTGLGEEAPAKAKEGLEKASPQLGDGASGRKRRTRRRRITPPPPGFGGSSWLHCQSEGGSKQCAKCDSSTGGTLPCKSVPSPPPGDWSGPPASNKIDACPDHEVLKNRKVFVQYGGGSNAGWSRCLPFSSWMTLNGYELKSRQFPGVKASHISDDVGNVVITKMAVLRPEGASANVGVLIVKRLVTHKCIGTKAGASCSAGATTADTLKLGYCIKCPVKKYTKPNCGSKCSVFTGAEVRASDDEKKAFVNECAPDAYDAATGKVKTEYQCTGHDEKQATATMLTF